MISGFMVHAFAGSPQGKGEALATLLGQGKIAVSNYGTGETIGHVIDLEVTNLTSEEIDFWVPLTVAESKSGESQDYKTKSFEAKLGPKETKTFSVEGICLTARKPAVKKGMKDELVFLDPASPAMIAEWGHVLAGTEAILTVVPQLQSCGALTTPFKDPKKAVQTVTQWAVWLYTSRLEGKPVTKDEFKRKTLEQAQAVRPLTPEQKKAMDPGIDDIWTSINIACDAAKPIQKAVAGGFRGQ